MNSALPGIPELAARLRDLRAASARLAAEHARLGKEHLQRRTAFEKQLAAGLARLSQDRSAARGRAAAEALERAAALERHRSARESRIHTAYTGARKAMLARIEAAEGRRKFAVQKGILDTEKNLASRVKNLEQEYAAAEQSAAGHEQTLAALREAARKSFRPFPGFPAYLRAAAGPSPAGSDPAALAGVARDDLQRYKSRILPDLFRFLPIWLWWLAGIALFLIGPARLGLPKSAFLPALGVALGVASALYLAGWFLSSGAARALAGSLAQADAALAAARRQSLDALHSNLEQARAEARATNESLQNEWQYATAEAEQARADSETQLDRRYDRALRQNQAWHDRRAEAGRGGLNQSAEGESGESGESIALRAAAERNIRALDESLEDARQAMLAEWQNLAEPARAEIEAAHAFAAAGFPPWSPDTHYRARESSLEAVKFGEARAEIAAPLPSAEALRLVAPLALVLPGAGSLIIESDDPGRAAAIDTLNNLVYRLLQSAPPGKAAFTLIDPVRLGQSFSSIMHLADFEENLVNRRIWTAPGEIEERLLELNAHLEKVIQMYLRNEFPDIAAYNRQAGKIAEKYLFVVVADFPSNFSETALRRLAKIAASGARCGVYLLLHWDKRQALLPGFDPREILEHCVTVEASKAGISVPALGPQTRCLADPPPAPELATRFLQEVGEASRGSNTVQVPFSQIAPPPEARWSLDTTEELRVPVGRSGATKLQYLSLGKGTRQHVLIAGKTGSGKSTLLHVLVTNLALWAGPDQAEFYLVDFKKGVEFKDYATARLPHARVVAIESDREFGLSVLQRIDAELRLRGEAFRAAGAQDLPAFKRAAPMVRMPRVLLIIDEFQELFTEDDAISQNAALLLDRIVRQGRAFGIHVILGSQTLGGAYSLARSTLGQMAVRIALQTSEADAYLIMDESNPAPRLLSRPGEGIYNDSGGALEANSPFQVVWLPEAERRERLREIQTLATARGESGTPVVFEGNTPADLRDNAALNDLNGDGQTVWLGLPNQIKGPAEVVLDRRSGKNLLIAGQQDDHARALLAAAVLSLAAQKPHASSQFLLLEMPGAPSQLKLAEIAGALPDNCRLIKPPELPEALRTLVQELERREAGGQGAPVYLVIHNLSAFKALRPEDEFSLSTDPAEPTPATDFQRLCADGPVQGIHVIAHVDGFNNANRFLGRKGLKEFSHRVLFQMSANDSASFADDPRAGSLGLNRALLFNEQEGSMEIFRPYARPPSEWLKEFSEKVRGVAHPQQEKRLLKK